MLDIKWTIAHVAHRLMIDEILADKILQSRYEFLLTLL